MKNLKDNSKKDKEIQTYLVNLEALVPINFSYKIDASSPEEAAEIVMKKYKSLNIYKKSNLKMNLLIKKCIKVSEFGKSVAAYIKRFL